MKVTAIIPAAGAGSRIARKKGVRKPFLVVCDKPVLAHTLLAIESSECVNDIIIMVHREDLPRCRHLLKKYGLKKVRSIVPGGKTRSESVKKGLAFLPPDCAAVLIHDGARPFVDKKIIRNAVNACKRSGAAVAGVPVTSTLKFVDRRLMIRSTPDRKRLYIAQTPQVFKTGIIKAAYNGPKYDPAVTDDSILVERLGHKVKIVLGSYRNIKITTPADLILADVLLKKRRI